MLQTLKRRDGLLQRERGAFEARAHNVAEGAPGVQFTLLVAQCRRQNKVRISGGPRPNGGSEQLELYWVFLTTDVGHQLIKRHHEPLRFRPFRNGPTG